MDNSGKNRYELLFMDDDVSDPLDNIIKKKVKQPAGASGAAVVPATAVTTSNKGQTNNTNKQNTSAANDSLKKNSSEKENKSFAMNKNVDFNRKSNTAGNNAATASVGGGGSGGGGVSKSKSNQQLGNNNQNANRYNRDNFNGPASQNRNSTSKPQNGETREQRNNRRNRENGIPGSMGGGGGGGGNGGVGEYNNDSQQRIRQNNQRFNGPPRNRSGADGGNVRGGKREFDRQSGSDKTGVKAVDKRDGAGAHNWGSVKQDIEDINKSNDEAGLTDKEESGNDQTATEQNASIEEETKELTLDEWKAQRQQRAKPQFNIRKAGEGEDVTQWKKMIALNNKKKVSSKIEGDSEEELEYDPSMYPQRVGRLQRVLDIQFHFNDGRRGGSGMGRGRGRGSRPIGGAERPVGAGGGSVGGNAGSAGGVGAAVAAPGGGRPEGPRVNVGRPRNENPRREGGGMDKQQRGGQHAPKVDDERQFPTLS